MRAIKECRVIPFRGAGHKEIDGGNKVEVLFRKLHRALCIGKPQTNREK